jgi:archaeosine synthase alpha-subunit
LRTAGRPEGLALGGTASIGPLRLRTPALLETRTDRDGAERPYVRSESSPSGSRRFVLGDGHEELVLETPVLAPEITPAGGGVTVLSSGAVMLHAPLDRSALRELRALRPELLILANGRALWAEGEPFVRALREIREEAGAEPLLWVPRVALPHRLALLTYLGVDVLDTTEGDLRASQGELLDPALGPRRPAAGGERGCDCPACLSAPPRPLVEHARAAYRRAELELRAAVGRGALRELVEARLAAEPALVERLRYADRDLAALLESRCPVADTTQRTYLLAESLRRPEMRRFRDRLLERYRPPPSKTVLLLVPCSRTKPYRHSPSHRRIAAALEGLRAAERVHVVSVSSPIGVVPRELEDVPPARHYDIPVTGDWSSEERELVRNGVDHLLATGGYRTVVAHLDPEEYGFLLERLAGTREVRRTVVDGRTTSAASLAELRAALETGLAGDRPAPGGPLAVVAEELREVASVQFGRTAAERLFSPPVRLTGRPWFQRITDLRHDLASLREERGLFHLTVAGAERIGDRLARVDAEPSLSLEGDLFVPGIRRADPTVRAGDAVGIFQDDRLAAVGEAALSGGLMMELRRGVGVLVRHRRHVEPDTDNSVELPSASGR